MKSKQQKQKLTYSIIGTILITVIILGTIIASSLNKQGDAIKDRSSNNSSYQETKTTSTTKDTSSIASENDKTTTTQSDPATTSDKSIPDNTKQEEAEHTNTPASNSGGESYVYDNTPASSYTPPSYSEPAHAEQIYTPPTPSYNNIEESIEDAHRTNKAVSDWDKAHGFGGDHIDSKGDGFLGW